MCRLSFCNDGYISAVCTYDDYVHTYSLLVCHVITQYWPRRYSCVCGGCNNCTICLHSTMQPFTGRCIWRWSWLQAQQKSKLPFQLLLCISCMSLLMCVKVYHKYYWRVCYQVMFKGYNNPVCLNHFALQQLNVALTRGDTYSRWLGTTDDNLCF